MTTSNLKISLADNPALPNNVSPELADEWYSLRQAGVKVTGEEGIAARYGYHLDGTWIYKVTNEWRKRLGGPPFPVHKGGRSRSAVERNGKSAAIQVNDPEAEGRLRFQALYAKENGMPAVKIPAMLFLSRDKYRDLIRGYELNADQTWFQTKTAQTNQPKDGRADVLPILAEQTGNRCTSCGKQEVSWTEFQMGHKTPKAKGGTDEFSNLAILCAYCNQLQGDRLISLRQLRAEAIERGRLKVSGLSPSQLAKILPTKDFDWA